MDKTIPTRKSVQSFKGLVFKKSFQKSFYLYIIN